MPRTRIFKSGNSQAVRIPREIAYSDTDIELEIRRSGDVVMMYPVRQSLKEMVEALRKLPRPPYVEKHVPILLPNRKDN